MPLRFRRSIKLLPGLKLNLSKGGISVSVGKPGATVNVSDKGARATVGLPGTGISYSERLAPGRRLMASSPKRGMSFGTLLLIGLGLLMVALWMLG